jgi:hypothetical protein
LTQIDEEQSPPKIAYELVRYSLLKWWALERRAPSEWIQGAPFYSKDYIYSFDTSEDLVTFEEVALDPKWRATMQQDKSMIQLWRTKLGSYKIFQNGRSQN